MALISRSRAMPAGGRPSSPGGGSKPSSRFFSHSDVQFRGPPGRGAGVNTGAPAVPALLRGWRSLSISPFPLPGDPAAWRPRDACGVGLGFETCELYLHQVDEFGPDDRDALFDIMDGRIRSAETCAPRGVRSDAACGSPRSRSVKTGANPEHGRDRGPRLYSSPRIVSNCPTSFGR